MASPFGPVVGPCCKRRVHGTACATRRALVGVEPDARGVGVVGGRRREQTEHAP